MITLKVDEGYAYDYLSILRVKLNKGLIPESTVAACGEHIKSQIGDYLHFSIINSAFYDELVLLNTKTFEAVDLAKTNSINASAVNDLNYERYLAKRKLQTKFFPQYAQTEKKNEQ